MKKILFLLAIPLLFSCSKEEVLDGSEKGKSFVKYVTEDNHKVDYFLFMAKGGVSVFYHRIVDENDDNIFNEKPSESIQGKYSTGKKEADIFEDNKKVGKLMWRKNGIAIQANGRIVEFTNKDAE